MNHTLSKSEFKLASDCYTKLKYKKNNYPKASDTDEFMEMLAEGGYMVGKLATLLYPGGVDINVDTTYSKDKYENTEEWMKNENVILFEAAFKTADGRNIRADIIEKKGALISLLEVKAKSWNSDTYIFGRKPNGSNKENVSADFKPYLEDVCFQYSVVKELYPDQKIMPYLFLPDKAANTNIEGLNGMFDITKIAVTASGFKSYDVMFTGDQGLLLADQIMTKVDVTDFVNSNLDIVLNRTKEMLNYMNNNFSEALAKKVLDHKCKSCDYRLIDNTSPQNGYDECWEKMGYEPNHFFNLYQFGNIFKSADNKEALVQLIRQKKITISDVPDELFVKKDGEYKYSGRPWYQKINQPETLATELKEAIAPLEYPLCFIDFECSRMALPYHKHMRPYEIVAYQWSCHIIEHENAEPVHYEWINTADSFPNFKFVQSLYDCLKNAGTILIWSSYEKTVLKDILLQYEQYAGNSFGGEGIITGNMIDWLVRWRDLEKDDSGWVCDMEKISRKYYYHPYTKGRSSIKPTLPAVLNETKDPGIISWLTNFRDGLNIYKNDNGEVQDPYYSLPKIDFDDLGISTTSGDDEEEETFSSGDDYIVRNGGAAMRAYQDMMYGFAKNDVAKKDRIRDGLLQYCELDTLAMVIIWKYWRSKF